MTMQQEVARVIANHGLYNHAKRTDAARKLKPKLGLTIKAIKAEIDRQLDIQEHRRLARDLPHQPALRDRLLKFLRVKTFKLAEERDISTPSWWPRIDWGKIDYLPVRKVWLFRATYIEEYSKRVGSFTRKAAFLCGGDDGHHFIVRVPSNIENAIAALEWLQPAAVKTAFKQGKLVLRQGDFYFIEKRMNSDNMAALDSTRHTYNAETRSITHPEHHTLQLPAGKHFRAVMGRQIVVNGVRGD